MARVKLSPIFTNISGSIGGMTVQRNKFGVSLRQKPLPIRSNSAAQYIVRQHMIAIQAAWQDLTDAQRLQWNRFLDFSGQTIKHDKSVKLSGHALYLKYQLYRLLTGFPLLTTITYVPMPEVPLVNHLTDYGAYANIVFYSTVDVSEYFWVLALSGPRTATRFFSQQGLRVCTTGYPPTDNAAYDIKPDYLNAFGIFPTTGSYIHYSIIWFSVNAPVYTGKITGVIQSN